MYGLNYLVMFGAPDHARRKWILMIILMLVCMVSFRSMILSRRANDDDSRDGFTKWPFMTTHTWGEYPQGTWTLEVW